MSVLKFFQKAKKSDVTDVNDKNADVEDDTDWNILPTLHAKDYYDKSEFERNRSIEKLMEKYNVAKEPSKGYEIL